MSEVLGDYIDRLVTVEMRNKAMNHDMIRQCYEAAREEGGGRPISTRAAEAVLGAVGRGDVVFLVTGAGHPPTLPKGESDGPPGVAALARVLFWGLGAVPIYVTETQHGDPVIASSEACGVMVREPQLALERGLGAALERAPEDQAAIADWAASLYERYQPKAILAAERQGANVNGKIYGSTGKVKAPGTYVDLGPVFDEAAARGVVSVAVGDNGNEVGFGRIYEFMQDFHPYGREPDGGVIATTATDILLPASVSNWGCYGIAAVMAYQLGKADLLHDAETEGAMLRACLDAGGWEARYCTSRFIVDGIEGETSMAMVQMLRNMVSLRLAEPDRGNNH